MPEPDDLAALVADLERIDREMIPIPWEADHRDWRNVPHPHDWYIIGDVHEDESDDIEEIDPEAATIIATSVAIVPGNPTSAPITEENAKGIATLRNAIPAILAALRQAQQWTELLEASRVAARMLVGEREQLRARAVAAEVDAESLRQQVAELRAGLEPFAKVGPTIPDNWPDTVPLSWEDDGATESGRPVAFLRYLAEVTVTNAPRVGAFRRAADLLARTAPLEEGK